MKLYLEDFTGSEGQKIASSLANAVAAGGFKVEKIWGEAIEDRGSQMTYSALGQQAPLEEKDKWDPDSAKRRKIEAILDTFIHEFSVRLGAQHLLTSPNLALTRRMESESYKNW